MLSAEAPNLKASLKKIIRDVTRRASESEDDVEVAVGQDVSYYTFFSEGLTDRYRGENISTTTLRLFMLLFRLTSQSKSLSLSKILRLSTPIS